MVKSCGKQEVAITDATRPQLYYKSSFAHNGNYSLRMYNRCVYAMPDLSATDVNISDLHLSMYLRQPNKSYQLEVGVWEEHVVWTETQEPVITGEFVPVHTFHNADNTITFVECDFSNYTGNGGRIAFRNSLYGSANYAYSYNYIDEITLSRADNVRNTALNENTDNGGIERYLESIIVYPNPTRDYINVQCTRNDEQLEVKGIEVIDVYGKVVHTVVGANNDSPTQINVSNLAAGMYFVRVTTEEGAVAKPFVKR